ncbi:MAG: DUF2284 domain-containing protein [Filifactor alocis]|nr:DUF2284 domain-containing protein [Filifactor alocis]
MPKISVRTRKISLDEMIEIGFEPQRIETYCKACSNYGKNWSCPPHFFDRESFLNTHPYIVLVIAVLEYSKDEILRNRGREEVDKYTTKTLFPLRRAFYEKLKKIERYNTDLRIFDIGNCNLCETCSREEGGACVKPDEMRYSPESLGFDVSLLLGSCFDLNLEWAGEVLPSHYISLGGLAQRSDTNITGLEELEAELVREFS